MIKQILAPRTIAFALLIAILLRAGAAHAQDAALLAAAEKGDVAAQIQLGYGFRDGKFGKEDPTEAFQWFGRAAATENAEAVDNLAWLLEHGLGAPADAAKARALYRQAAEKKHVPAQGNLARCLREGIGGAADAGEALRWASEAWQLKPDKRTANGLAATLLVQPSLAPHAALLEQLSACDSYPALVKLARIFDTGQGGITQDSQRARELFARARKFGLPASLLDPFQLEELAARPAKAGEFAYLSTRHIDQGFNMCAPASAAMALEFYLHKPVDQYAIKAASTGATQPGTGTAWDCMLRGIRTVSNEQWEFRSWPNNDAGFEAGLPVLLCELDAGRVALIDLGPHTVVLAGYSARQRVVYINNPAFEWPGLHTVSYDNLHQRWHSPWHVTTTHGVEARPVLLTGPKDN